MGDDEMRYLTSKYEGECRACGADIEVGQEIGYERRVGAFCRPCTPTDLEEIRRYRLEAAERKAARYEEWAEARERKAAQERKGWDERSKDWAYVTQPGHIPQRARDLRAVERSWDHSRKAEEHREKAAMAGAFVRVKGDAEAARQRRREIALEAIKRAGTKPGDKIECHPYGVVTLVRINKKSATVETGSGFRDRVCLSWIARAKVTA